MKKSQKKKPVNILYESYVRGMMRGFDIRNSGGRINIISFSKSIENEIEKIAKDFYRKIEDFDIKNIKGKNNDTTEKFSRKSKSKKNKSS